MKQFCFCGQKLPLGGSSCGNFGSVAWGCHLGAGWAGAVSGTNGPILVGTSTVANGRIDQCLPMSWDSGEDSLVDH